MLSFPNAYCAAAFVFLCLTGSACTPTLNWREVRPEGGGVRVLFPCRPSLERRSVNLAGTDLSMQLSSCQAGGATYALALVPLNEEVQTESIVSAWKLTQVQNLNAVIREDGAWKIKNAGMRPEPTRRLLVGTLPDGEPMQQAVIFFTKDAHLFQATVMGPQLDPEAQAVFFESIQWLE